MTREQKRRIQRIRANIAGLAILSTAMSIGGVAGAVWAGSTYKQPDALSVSTIPQIALVKPPRLVSIGNFRVYAYCPCPGCCGQWSGGPTASGVMPEEGRTVAADWDVLPAGTEIYIDGVGWRTVEDTGSGINGHTLDLYMDSHQDALEWGVQEVEVFVTAP